MNSHYVDYLLTCCCCDFIHIRGNYEMRSNSPAHDHIKTLVKNSDHFNGQQGSSWNPPQIYQDAQICQSKEMMKKMMMKMGLRPPRQSELRCVQWHLQPANIRKGIFTHWTQRTNTYSLYNVTRFTFISKNPQWKYRKYNISMKITV